MFMENLYLILCTPVIGRNTRVVVGGKWIKKRLDLFSEAKTMCKGID